MIANVPLGQVETEIGPDNLGFGLGNDEPRFAVANKLL